MRVVCVCSLHALEAWIRPERRVNDVQKTVSRVPRREDMCLVDEHMCDVRRVNACLRMGMIVPSSNNTYSLNEDRSRLGILEIVHFSSKESGFLGSSTHFPCFTLLNSQQMYAPHTDEWAEGSVFVQNNDRDNRE